MEGLVGGAAFWRGRRVFLTGHTGFKGSWLSALLGGWGAEVHGFALPPVRGAIYETAGVEALLASSTLGDVRDPAALGTALKRSGAETVFHLAAQPLVRPSYELPVETYATNVMGTVHLLDAVRGTPGIRAVVIVTSDKCYDNRERIRGYREDEPMGGYDPYSSSKGCCELVTDAFRRSFFAQGPRLASVRAGNVVGGGDVARDRLVPDLIRGLRAGERTLIRNPHAVRPWQHVLEPLSGYLRLAERLCAPDGARLAEGWNFGPGAAGERSVTDVADAVCRAWGPDGAWQRDEAAHVHEAGFLALDTAKARRHLAWTPRYDFETMIAATVAWYRAETEGRDMLAFTQSQIADYFSTPVRH